LIASRNGSRALTASLLDPDALSLAAADLVVVAHAAFVAFVVLGGLLVLRWRRLAWVHLPAAIWGVIVEFAGWICPLTPLENYLRQRGGTPAYQGDFIERYVMPLLYPAHLTRQRQILLGSFAIVVNLFVYWLMWRSDRRRRSRSRGHASPE
jgi:hypothetical protein